jgi:general secretion pathway protein G
MIQRSLAKKRSGEGGFTLIELLIVIVILGILAAIVVLAIGSLKSSSQTAACNSGQKTIETAEDAYFASSNPNVYTDGAGLLTAGLVKSSITNDWDVTFTGGKTYTVAPHPTGTCDGLAGVTSYTYTAP